MIDSRPGRLALQLWVAAFVGFFGTYLLNTVDGLRVPVQVIYALPLAVWAARSLRGPRDWLDLAVLVAAAAHLVVAFAGVDPTGSASATGMALGFAVLFWLTRDLATRPRLRSAVAAAIAVPATGWMFAAAVAWIVEKVEWIVAGGGIPALESYQVFVWGTTNAFPVLGLLTVPFLAFVAPGPLRRLLIVLFGFSMILVVPLSVGRAGWLGIAAALVAFEALSGWARARIVARRVRAGRPRVAAGALAGTAILLSLALNGDRLLGALGSNLESRARIWNQAVGVFGADPITGSGPGTFSWMRLAHVPQFSDPIGVFLAHNAWLQTLADGGVLLGAAFGAVVLLWVGALWRGRAGMTVGERAAAASVIGLGAASLLDDFSFLPAMVAMAVTLAAWSVPSPRTRWRVGAAARPWLLSGALLVAAVVTVPTIDVERARLIAGEGRSAAVAGRWQEAADLFAAASALHPTNPLLHLSRGLALAETGDQAASREAYGRARALSPGDPRAAGALAALAEEPGERIRLLEVATRTSTDAQYAVRLSSSLREIGDAAAAAEAYALAVVLRTDLYAWLDDGATGPAAADVRAAIPAVASKVHARDPDRVRRVLWDVRLADGTLPRDAPAAWRAVAQASAGRREAARNAVAESRRAAPHDQMTHLAAAAVARFACDEDAYRRTMRLAGRMLGGPVPSLAIGRDPVYRDVGLGDFQPSWVERPPSPSIWPFGLIEEPECGWRP